MPKYVGYTKVREHYSVSAQTVKNWALRGSINYRAIQNDTRKTWLYDLESIGNYIGQKQIDDNQEKERQEVTILYCRVSSKKQELDLCRQVELLSNAYPDGEVVKDIGSGLNYSRQGFSKMVERICRGDIQRVVVTYKDRLMRFGNELFEQICKENNCKILVYSQEQELYDVEEGETRELQEDLLSIVNVFVARRNGKRAGAMRRQRKRFEGTTNINDESKNLSNDETENKA